MSTMIDVHKPRPGELEALGTADWPIWTCEPSRFAWSYDERETCHVLAGEVTVETADGAVSFGAGDVVVFPQGLDCTWIVHRAVRKHYRFG